MLKIHKCFIADLAVGIGADLIKCGPPVQAERTEKFNRLLEIEKELEDNKALPAESFSY
ncbi:MAG: hypothetical protein GX770_07775 [Firmicutes bacterium]|nr:hypothetical protein [Bacillota bacterium]